MESDSPTPAKRPGRVVVTCTQVHVRSLGGKGAVNLGVGKGIVRP